MINTIKRYLTERKNASDIFYIIDTGVLISQTADSMGRKKLLKPTEYEIDEFINKCIKIKECLIKKK